MKRSSSSNPKVVTLDTTHRGLIVALCERHPHLSWSDDVREKVANAQLVRGAFMRRLLTGERDFIVVEA
jgi:hypothetical protein